MVVVWSWDTGTSCKQIVNIRRIDSTVPLGVFTWVTHGWVASEFLRQVSKFNMTPNGEHQIIGPDRSHIFEVGVNFLMRASPMWKPLFTLDTWCTLYHIVSVIWLFKKTCTTQIFESLPLKSKLNSWCYLGCFWLKFWCRYQMFLLFSSEIWGLVPCDWNHGPLPHVGLGPQDPGLNHGGVAPGLPVVR